MTDKLKKDVMALRQTIDDVKEEINGLDRYLVPKETAVARIDAFIEQRASEWLNLTHYFAGQDYHAPGLIDMQSVGVERFLCRFDPKMIRDGLVADLDRIYQSGQALSAAELAKKRTALESKLFDLEVREERLIVQAYENDEPIGRRRDADPRAVLEA